MGSGTKTGKLVLWSSACADEIKEAMMIKTQKGQNKFPFENSSKILGHIFNTMADHKKVWN